jgi:hypothetical protein
MKKKHIMSHLRQVYVSIHKTDFFQLAHKATINGNADLQQQRREFAIAAKNLL